MAIQRMDNVLIVVDDLDDAPANTLGIRRILFEVDVYRLCHVRGPEGIVVGLAEPVS